MNIYTTLLVEFLLLSSSILLLFKLRAKIGLAPLYILLGAIQYLQASAGSVINFNILEWQYTIYPSSVIIFSALLFAVLLIYIKEGASSARALIIGITIANLLLSALFGITYLQETILGILDDVNTHSVFDINYKYFIIGTIILLFDFILMVIIYQFLVTKISKLYYFLILFISLASVLIFDSVVFNLLLKYNEPDFTASLIGHIIGKTFTAFVFSIILYIYLKFVDKEKGYVSFIASQNRDIFSILTYEKKYKELKLEKQQVEKKLTSQLETTLDNISDGFVSLDTNWCYTYVNKKAAEFLGKSQESLIGKHIWTEFPDGVGLPFYKAYYEAVETQKTIYFDDHYVPFDKWFENRIYPSAEGLTIYFTDITEQKKADLALKESENRIRTILETEPECIKQLNAKGELIYMNRAGLAMIEADNLEMVKGESIINLISPKYQFAFKKLTKNVFKGNSGHLEFEIIGLRGTNRWLETHAVPLKDSGGNIISLLGVTRDVTARKEADTNNQMLRSLIETSDNFIGLADLEGKPIYLNTNGRNLVGLDASEKLSDSIVDFFPEQYQNVIVNEHMPNIFENNKWSGEAHFQNSKTGDLIPIEMSGFLIKDSTTSKPIALGIVATDITERKKAEEKIINSEQLFRRLSSNAPVAIFQAEKDGACNYVNEEWIKYSGQTFNDALGFGWSNAIHHEDKERVISEWQKSVSTETEFITDMRLLHKNGEMRWLSAKAVSLVDVNDVLYGYIGMLTDITERKKAEEQIIKSEKYLDSIINNIGDPVFVKDDQSHFLIANNAFYTLFNRTKEEILGKTFAEDVPLEERERYLKIDKQVISKGIENIDEDSITIEGEGKRFLSTKKTRFVDESGTKFLIGTIRDITKSKNAEEELINSKIYLDNIINNIGDPVFVKDDQSRMILVNDALCSLFNMTRAEILSKTLAENVPLKERESFLSIDKQVILSGIENVNEETLTMNENETRVISTKKTRFVDSSGNKFLVGVIRDITARKKAEIELENYKNNLEELIELRTTELEKEKVKAQSADLMKSAFLATMSHELRTPMNSIIGFAGILLNELPGPLNKEQNKQLMMVKNSGQHLLGLINDILDISKIEAGKLKVSKTPFNYLISLENTIEFLSPQANKKGIQINTELSESEIILNSDERRVEQVLLNLISNAIKFSYKGAIDVKVVVENNVLTTQIIDHGIGISNEDLNKLFMPFIQLDGGLNRSQEGTGLGLAICKSLIEKLGGTIQVKSKIGEGTNFTFTLPIEQTDNK